MFFWLNWNSTRFYAAIEAAKEARRYEPVPRFPAVERDFSLLLADGTKFSEVTKTIQSLGIAEIHGIEATDLFRGKKCPCRKILAAGARHSSEPRSDPDRRADH